MTGTMNSHMRRLFVAVVVAGAVVRAILCFGFVPRWEAASGMPPSPDSYPTLASTLLSQGTLGYGPEGATPTTVRGPGFPAWLAVGIILGGESSAWLGFWGSIPEILVAGWMAIALARRRGLLAGAVAGIISALHPLPALIASRSVADEFVGATGLGGLLCWAHALRAREARSRLLWTATAASFLSVHALTRVSGIITILCAIGFGLYKIPRRISLTVLLTACCLFPVTAWSVRSSLLEGRPVIIHSLGPYNFWVGEAFNQVDPRKGPGVLWGDVAAFVLEKAEMPDVEPNTFWYGKLTPVEVAAMDATLASAALEHISGNPLGYAERVAKGLGQFWYRSQTPGRGLLYLSIALPVLLLAALGVRAIVRTRNEDREFAWLLLAVIVLHNLAYAATLPMARMSVQVYPELAWLAGIGLASLGWWNGNRRDRLPGARS